MKAYSVEFRQKIIQVYQEEKISQAKLAMRFRVALSFVEKIIKQWRETGDVSPKPHGGGQKMKYPAAASCGVSRKGITVIVEL